MLPTGTRQLHRVLRATPERIYRAFLNADAIANWLPSYGFTGLALQHYCFPSIVSKAWACSAALTPSGVK